MLCYLGRTFCADTACAKFDKCPTALTDQVKADAVRWWGTPSAPIAVYGERLNCYEEKENE